MMCQRDRQVRRADEDPVDAVDATGAGDCFDGSFLARLAAGHDANKIFIENGRDHGDRIARALTAGRVSSATTPR